MSRDGGHQLEIAILCEQAFDVTEGQAAYLFERLHGIEVAMIAAFAPLSWQSLT